MSQISLQEAQSKLAELIAGLKPGEEVDITQNNQTVAKLVSPKRQRQQCNCRSDNKTHELSPLVSTTALTTKAASITIVRNCITASVLRKRKIV